MQYVSRYNLSPAPLELGTTHSLYARARERARRGQLWSMLTGRPSHLLSLAEIDAIGAVGTRSYGGTQLVPIDQIRGTEGRTGDFDRDFNPLHDCNKDRWLRVAAAWQRGKALPPVALIQVGDVYFVQDGHHRISVARALGQRDIEAEVTVWNVTGPFSGEGLGTGQEMGIERLSRKVYAGSLIQLSLPQIFARRLLGTLSRTFSKRQPGILYTKTG